MISELTPTIDNNILLLLLYLAFGVGFPLLFILTFRKIKNLISVIITNK